MQFTARLPCCIQELPKIGRNKNGDVTQQKEIGPTKKESDLITMNVERLVLMQQGKSLIIKVLNLI